MLFALLGGHVDGTVNYQSAASQDTPLQTPEQTQVVIPPDQQGIPDLQVDNHHHAVWESGGWMMPVVDSNDGRIVLPVAPPVPTSTPFDGFVSLPGMEFGGAGGNGTTMMEDGPGLWGKLQAFYEPSVPLFWEGDASCGGNVNPEMAMPGYGGGGGMNGGGFGYEGTF